MENRTVREMIIERTGCTEAKAELIEKKLENLSPQLQPLLREWLQTGKESDDTRYGGYSLDDLMRGYGMRFTGALLTLDWLVKAPKEAGMALRFGIK